MRFHKEATTMAIACSLARARARLGLLGLSRGLSAAAVPNLGQLPAWARVPEGHIDFSVGQPARDLLPLEVLRRASQAALAGAGPGDLLADERVFLQYGSSQGGDPFLTTLASFLTRQTGAPVDPSTLCVTNGVSQAVELCCSVFCAPGDAVLVDSPTYFLMGKIFKDHGLRVISVPTDSQGLVVDAALEALVEEVRPSLIYTIPVHSNPASATMPPERCEALVALARRHEVIVAADEVYQLLGFPTTAGAAGGGEGGAGVWPSLSTYDSDSDNDNDNDHGSGSGNGTSQGGVVSLHSFSKILCPGLRLGWLQAMANWYRDLGG